MVKDTRSPCQSLENTLGFPVILSSHQSLEGTVCPVLFPPPPPVINQWRHQLPPPISQWRIHMIVSSYSRISQWRIHDVSYYPYSFLFRGFVPHSPTFLYSCIQLSGEHKSLTLTHISAWLMPPKSKQQLYYYYYLTPRVVRFSTWKLFWR